MSLEVVGPIDQMARDRLLAFFSALHGRWSLPDRSARLVVAQPGPDMRRTIGAALQEWMKPEEFSLWRTQQVGRPVATAGKTFTGRDEVITAVTLPVVADNFDLLGIAFHELVEIAIRIARPDLGEPNTGLARDVNSAVFVDEYFVDRTRVELSIALGFPEGQVDANPDLFEQADDLWTILEVSDRLGNPPDEFWQHWVNIARVWSMVAGRCAGGRASACAELERWLTHPMVSLDWTLLKQQMDTFYGRGTPQQLPFTDAPEVIWDPIERLGRDAWAGI